jgi:TonB family protein
MVRGLGLAGLAGLACVATVAAWGAWTTGGPVVLAEAQQKVSAQIPEADEASWLEEFAPGVPRKGTPGLLLPKLRKSSHPKYTPAAMRAKIEGMVLMHAIVGADGHVEKSRVWRSLDTELDAQALKALSEWEFEPGQLNGAPTRVAVEVQMQFKLH